MLLADYIVQRLRTQAFGERNGKWFHDLQIIQRTGHGAPVLIQDTSVNHGDGHVSVSEQFLCGTDIVTSLLPMNRETGPCYYCARAGFNRVIDPVI